MAYAQSSLHVEIQTLRDTLAATEKKAARYEQMSKKCYHDSDC